MEKTHVTISLSLHRFHIPTATNSKPTPLYYAKMLFAGYSHRLNSMIDISYAINLLFNNACFNNFLATFGIDIEFCSQNTYYITSDLVDCNLFNYLISYGLQGIYNCGINISDVYINPDPTIINIIENLYIQQHFSRQKQDTNYAAYVASYNDIVKTNDSTALPLTNININAYANAYAIAVTSIYTYIYIYTDVNTHTHADTHAHAHAHANANANANATSNVGVTTATANYTDTDIDTDNYTYNYAKIDPNVNDNVTNTYNFNVTNNDTNIDTNIDTNTNANQYYASHPFKDTCYIENSIYDPPANDNSTNTNAPANNPTIQDEAYAEEDSEEEDEADVVGILNIQADHANTAPIALIVPEHTHVTNTNTATDINTIDTDLAHSTVIVNTPAPIDTSIVTDSQNEVEVVEDTDVLAMMDLVERLSSRSMSMSISKSNYTDKSNTEITAPAYDITPTHSDINEVHEVTHATSAILSCCTSPLTIAPVSVMVKDNDINHIDDTNEDTVTAINEPLTLTLTLNTILPLLRSYWTEITTAAATIGQARLELSEKKKNEDFTRRSTAIDNMSCKMAKKIDKWWWGLNTEFTLNPVTHIQFQLPEKFTQQRRNVFHGKWDDNIVFNHRIPAYKQTFCAISKYYNTKIFLIGKNECNDTGDRSLYNTCRIHGETRADVLATYAILADRIMYVATINLTKEPSLSNFRYKPLLANQLYDVYV
jgi:hypothetical protein